MIALPSPMRRARIFVILASAIAARSTPGIAAQLTLPANITVGSGASVTFQKQGATVTALQFDLLFDSGTTGGLSIRGAAGAAGIAAGKTLSSSPINGGVRFVLLGINQTPIGDGSVVDLIIQPNFGAAGTYPLIIGGVVASDPQAVAVATNSSSGNITVGGVCNFSVDSTGASVDNGSGMTGTSLTGTFNVTAISCNRSNTWTAVSDSPYLVITSNASGNGGTPSTTVTYAMYTNSTTLPRTAHIFVVGHVYTVTQAGSVETPSQRVVRALYQTILGREPDFGGWYFWTGSGAPTARGSVLFNQMADGFYRSPEFRDSGFAVLSIYQAINNQLPIFSQWLSNVTQIRQGTITTTQLTDFLAGQLSNTAFVQAAIQNSFGRAPTATEMNNYPAGLGNGTYSSKFDFLNRVIFQDPAFQAQTNNAFVRALFYTILVRDPDAGGSSFWLGQLNAPLGMPGIYYSYLTPPAAYAQKLAVIGQAVPPNPALLGFLGSPEFQGLIQ